MGHLTNLTEHHPDVHENLRQLPPPQNNFPTYPASGQCSLYTSFDSDACNRSSRALHLLNERPSSGGAPGPSPPKDLEVHYLYNKATVPQERIDLDDLIGSDTVSTWPSGADQAVPSVEWI